jgi:cytochrome c553
LFFISLAANAGKAETEKMVKTVCAPCHGVDGFSLVLAYPHLAGQQKKYLVDQLEAFRSGDRQSPKLMNPIAEKLSDREISSLAKYYSKLPRCKGACASAGE